MMKKLTYRQQQFLSQFLDIYQKLDQPIHYGTVAEYLGVGNVTAYEMLRLLEERGLVRAEYQPKSEQGSPGRPSVLFSPTKEARQLLAQLSGNSDLEDWEKAKKHILSQLHQGGEDYDELLTILIARMPENRSPLIFMTEMITAVILVLRSVPDSPEIRTILNSLRKIGLPEEFGLSVLSGVLMILSALERTNRIFSSALLAELSRYEEYLLQLNKENRQLLSAFAREVAQIVTG